MLDVAGVKFRGNNKICYFKTGGLRLRPGDAIIASTEKGTDLGFIHYTTKKPKQGEDLRRILRKASSFDLEKLTQNEDLERQARWEAQKLAKQMSLQMEFVACIYSLDASRVTLFFLAEKRIDFRDLVRELAKKFHAKVELWQIGSRDETRIFGGIGPCNREFCCHTFLSSKESVTIKDAKCQRLDINPQKITGMCGKLMCCLKYECDLYKDMLRDYPEDGETVMYKDEQVKVISVNPFAGTVSVVTPEHSLATAQLEEISRYCENEWIPAKDSFNKMQEQKAKRARFAQEMLERSKLIKSKKKHKRPSEQAKEDGNQLGQEQASQDSLEDQEDQQDEQPNDDSPEQFDPYFDAT